MAGNVSGGDFACCGNMYKYCVQQKGCGYCGGGVDNLMYASQHCNVFNKLYVEKDEEFIKKWTNQKRGQPMRTTGGHIVRTTPTKPTKQTSLDDLLKQAQDLIKQYKGGN